MVQNDDVRGSDEGAVRPEPAAPITSRFLFVDIAAQRAKQLRRGALPRLERPAGASHKLERLAMEEVRQGLIEYALPTLDDLHGRGRAGE